MRHVRAILDNLKLLWRAFHTAWQEYWIIVPTQGAKAYLKHIKQGEQDERTEDTKA